MSQIQEETSLVLITSLAEPLEHSVAHVPVSNKNRSWLTVELALPLAY